MILPTRIALVSAMIAGIAGITIVLTKSSDTKGTLDSEIPTEETLAITSDSRFKNVKRSQIGFLGVTNGKQLRIECKAAYSGTFNEDTGIIVGTNKKKYLEEDVWRFCSPLGGKPKPTAEPYASNSIAGSEENKKKLISTTTPTNKIFWEIKQKHFFSEEGKPSNMSLFFRNFYNKNKNKVVPGMLMKKCEEAYRMVEAGVTSVDAPTAKEVIRFCSLEGK